MTLVRLRRGMNFPGRGTNRRLELGRTMKLRMGMRAFSRWDFESRNTSGDRVKILGYGLRFNSGSEFFNSRVQRRALLTTSYNVGPSTPPLLPHTIPEHFSEIVGEFGDRLAVISRPVSASYTDSALTQAGSASEIAGNLNRLTYRNLDELSNSLAGGLRDLGVRKGDRVAVSLGNGWDFAVGSYAIWKLGGVLVPLNPSFNAPQVIAALTHLDVAHLIIGTETNLAFKPPRENMTLLKEIIPDLTNKGTLPSPTVPSLRNLILVDNSNGKFDTSNLKATTLFMSLFEPSTASQVVIPDSPLSPNEIINIQFTSGTTSTPKAASLTHRSILNNGFQIGSRMGLTPADIICCPPPLFHCFGSILGYMATATHGTCILFPSPAFDPVATLLSVQEEKATGLYGVPTMFTAELELLSSGKISREGFQYLRTGIAAGSSIPSHLMSRLTRELNLDRLTICYGMTETSPVSCMTFPDDPLEKRLHTVGRLLPHVEAKIVAPSLSSHPGIENESRNGDEILPIGTKGELLVSGYNVMKSYWGSPSRTSEVLQKDQQGKLWMRTGDEAVMDEEGYVSITGRIKDLIIRGGENIHPLEVEDCLFGMEEVSAVSVVGIGDERYGEVVGAFVVVHEGVETDFDDSRFEISGMKEGKRNNEGKAKRRYLGKQDVRTWVRERLSSHLVPRYVFWVSDFPKTASGKVQKFKLREMGERFLKEGRVEHDI